MNLSAYYFAFEPTGEPVIDAVLSAVATAGDGAHHTEGWGEHGYDEAIQDAAAKAAAELTRLREIERLAADYLRIKHADCWTIGGPRAAVDMRKAALAALRAAVAATKEQQP